MIDERHKALMKAIIYKKYGGPGVLTLKEVPRPVAGEGEVLVKIHAAAANPLDWHFMRGTPYMMRLISGIIKPKVTTLGVDFSGEVVATGTKAREFKIGDMVLGALSSGAYAEYAVIPEKAPIVKKPTALSYHNAAAIPVAGVTALQGLRDSGRISEGESVLINGASGGVGSFAVQLAVYFGAKVTAVCSTPNLPMVRSLGASRVIDYTLQDFSRMQEKYHLIFDLVGNRPVWDYHRALKPGGKAVLCGFSSSSLLAQHLVLGPLSSLGQSRKVKMMPTARPNKHDMAFLASLAERGVIKPVIDRRYTLETLPDAVRYLETGRARGKLIIAITP